MTDASSPSDLTPPPPSAARAAGKHAQPAIAGGYGVSSGTACLSPKLEVAQSGQYISLSNALSTVSGNLTLKQGHLTGTVNCADHAREQLDGRYVSGILQGTLGGQPMSAQLRPIRRRPAARCRSFRAPSPANMRWRRAPSAWDRA